MAGYSDTPLMKKLGIKENFAVGVVNSPANLDIRYPGEGSAASVSRSKRQDRWQRNDLGGMAEKKFEDDN